MRLLLCLLVVLTASSAWAWGPMHARITEAAVNALPPWQQEMLAAQRQRFIDYDCIIPDLMRSAAQRKVLGRFMMLPNGEAFLHEPHSHEYNLALMEHYFAQALERLRAGDADDGARWAGCLLHFVQDCGSPAHAMPGDNQHGFMQDLLPVPEAFKGLPLHSFIESGTLQIDLAGYRPRLLGTTAPEAMRNLLERLYAEIRNARAQIIPILQGVFAKDEAVVDAARRRAARFDAEVSADALYTLFCMAKGQFAAEETAPLERAALSAWTPQEVIQQSYFPQYTYFSNPYFGFPVRDGIMAQGATRAPLLLHVLTEGTAKETAMAHGLGFGTTTRLTYALPARVYERLEGWVGLHAQLGREGQINVRIYVDGAAVFESGLITGADPARRLSIPLYRATQLNITVEASGAAPKGGNYVVLGEPTLVKIKTPPANDPHLTH